MSYAPRPGSGVARMLAILRSYPPGTSVLVRDLVTEAMGRKPGGWSNWLSPAVDAGLVAIDRSSPRNHRIKLGPGLPSDAPPQPVEIADACEPVQRVIPAQGAQRIKTRAVASVFDLASRT